MRLRDSAFGIDQVGDPPRIVIVGRLTGAISDTDRASRVGQKRKGEPVLLGEVALLRGSVEAAAQNDRVEFREVVVKVAEPGPFNRSAGCVGLGKEPENHPLATESAQSNPIPGVVLEIELRSFNT